MDISRFIRSVCEKSCVVWHSSLTNDNSDDLERVQKTALKVIYKQSYISYKNALTRSKLEKLSFRRKKLCLKFARKCLKNDRVKHMFPKNCKTGAKPRYREKFQVFHANTDRLKNSAVPFMQRLLNQN